MLNQVVLVGRLTSDPEAIKTEKGKKRSRVTVAVPRSYKNSEGLYDTDFIHCVLWNGIASNTCEYCKKGDIVGVKGRIQSRTVDKMILKKINYKLLLKKLHFYLVKKQTNSLFFIL